jgi:hypothetical protein
MLIRTSRFFVTLISLLIVAPTNATAAVVNFDSYTAGALPAEWVCGVTGSGNSRWTVESAPHGIAQIIRRTTSSERNDELLMKPLYLTMNSTLAAYGIHNSQNKLKDAYARCVTAPARQLKWRL